MKDISKQTFNEDRYQATSHRVDPLFQTLLIIITTTVVAGIMYLGMQRFTIFDAYPDVTSLTPQDLYEMGGPPTRIDVGITIRHFSEFDIIKGQFTADLSIWFRFNPEHITVAEVSKFVFEKAEIKSQSRPFIKIDGKDFVMHYDMVVQFSIPLNYSSFPLDNHRLALILDNYFISPSQAYFETSKANIEIEDELSVEGWSLRDVEGQMGYFKSVIKGNENKKSMYHPRAIFLLDFEQTGIRHLVAICLPLLLIFYLAFFSFSSFNTNGAVAVAAGSIAALIGFRFVMQETSPATGYFMISDYIFLIFLLASIVILLFNLFGNYFNEYQKRLVLVGLHGMIIFVFFYFFVWSL